MSDVIKNRSEILFLYDVTDANPNGDPMEENRPRIDEETGVNIVTDVRLKRTIRDYLRDFKEQNIFIQAEKVIEEGTELIKARGTKLTEEIIKVIIEEIAGNDKLRDVIEKINEIVEKEEEEEKQKIFYKTLGNKINEEEKKEFFKKFKEIEGIIKSIDEILKEGSKGKRQKLFNEALGDAVDEERKKELFEKFEEIRTKKLKEKLFDKFIDLRLFGATLAVANIGVQETGPVQFKFGRSLHKVDVNFYKGSITMPVEPGEDFKKGKRQAEFSEEYKLPYSLICFYGVVNENAAKNTGLSEDDIKMLLDGIWNGTKNLITRSKIGQMPRFLLRVVYKENNFHIGDLDKMIKLKKMDGNDLSEEEQEKIRDISEVRVDISELISALGDCKDKIERVEFKADKRVTFMVNDSILTSDELKNEFTRGIGLQDNQVIELEL
ncbi:MAG: type I-B CRISPR-associated protein Cas7/Csh2 [Thermoplasmata archaeon]|nr:MAG: type I-B CRISPR-associated protein Cas7/Csh2 [Thermoplasmata archaeon]